MLTLNLNLLWTVVNVLVLFLLLRKFLYRPVMNIIAERQHKLREADAQTTALARAMCEKLLARHLTAQDDARLLDDLLEKAGAGNGN